MCFSPYRGRGDGHPVLRRSPRRPWRYAPDMPAMLGHAMGINIKSSRQSRETGARKRALFIAFCVAEHRRDWWVERHGRRESLAAPWMAHQGVPLNPEKRKGTGRRPATHQAVLFSGSVFFVQAKKMNTEEPQAHT